MSSADYFVVANLSLFNRFCFHNCIVFFVYGGGYTAPHVLHANRHYHYPSHKGYYYYRRNCPPVCVYCTPVHCRQLRGFAPGGGAAPPSHSVPGPFARLPDNRYRLYTQPHRVGFGKRFNLRTGCLQLVIYLLVYRVALFGAPAPLLEYEAVRRAPRDALFRATLYQPGSLPQRTRLHGYPVLRRVRPSQAPILARKPPEL